MKKTLLLLLFLFSIAAISSCFAPSANYQVFSETEVKRDTVVHFKSTSEKPKHINDTLIYYWTKSGRVNKTQGFFGGRLLHDEYSETVGPLLVKAGYFNKGLMFGKWKTWEGENLQSIYTWKDGVLHGGYTLFDSNGEVLERGSYIKGKKKQ